MVAQHPVAVCATLEQKVCDFEVISAHSEIEDADLRRIQGLEFRAHIEEPAGKINVVCVRGGAV